MFLRSALLLSTLAIAAPAQAQSGQESLDALFACSAIQQDSVRLACLDAAVAALRSDVAAGRTVDLANASPAPAAPAASEGASFGSEPEGRRFRLPGVPFFGRDRDDQRAEGASVEESEAFGRAQPTESDMAINDSEAGVAVVERDRDGDVDRVRMRIADTQIVGYNTMIFVMENGQRWRQLSGRPLRMPRDRDQWVAEIRRASLGSYFLQVNGEGAAVRVRRED